MKNRININNIYLFLLIIGILACRKDKPITPKTTEKDTECYEFPMLVLSFFSKERFQYQTPYFNPNNANEFVYNYKDFKLNEYKLMKYNIQTGVKFELISDVKIISQPKWSKKGWIAFDNVFNHNYQMWIIKDNGDSLTQQSTSGGNIFPTWNATGNNLYWMHSPITPPAHPYYFVQKTLNNSVIDTIMYTDDENNGYTGYNEIGNDNILITNTYINNQEHLAYTDINNISFTSLFNTYQEFQTDFCRGLTWSNDNKTVYFSIPNKGLFEINIFTKKHTLLIEYCDSKRYKTISCSSDGKKLIGERIDSYNLKDSDGNPTAEIVQNSSIYIIDLITLEETKINLE